MPWISSPSAFGAGVLSGGGLGNSGGNGPGSGTVEICPAHDIS